MRKAKAFPTTSAVPASLAGATLQAFIDVPRRFKSFAVDHDRFAPMLRCGEFAVIDTSSTDPEEGQFVLFRSENPWGVHQAIVRLEQPDQSLYMEPAGETADRPLWMLIYGRSPVIGWTPACARLALHGYMTSADGPIGDRCLRGCIVGRVVGVLRAFDGRAPQ